MLIAPARVIGRYALYGEIAAGGMATVHYGRLLGPVGFSRTVAIKRLHAQFAKNPEFVSMFLDEARIAARIRHPNVVATLDVVATEGELFLVMDYVQGESLSRLAKVTRARKERMPPRIVAAVMCGALHGLHAAHEARNERGEPLGIVHRDISPQNILVGTDGTSRVLDFGVAKASGRIQNTKEGHLKGKIAYMAPEQIRGTVTRKADIYAASIVAWELVTGQRLFACDDEVETIAKVLDGQVEVPSKVAPDVPSAFDDVLMKGLAFEADARYATAREMALALEKCVGMASPSEVGDWVESHAAEILSMRAEMIHEIENSSSSVLSVDGANILAQLKSRPPPKPTSKAEAEESTHDAPLPVPLAAAVAPAALATPAAPVADPPKLVEAASEAAPGSRPRASQSTISVSRAAEVPPARTSKFTAAWILSGVVVVALGLGVALGRGSNRASTSSAVAPAESVAAAAPVATAPDSTATPDPSSAHESPPAPSTDPQPSATADSSATSTRPRIATPGVPPTRVHPASAKPQKTNCSPPFTIDEAGRKKYKPECL